MLLPEVLMGVSLLLWFVFLRLPLGFLTVTAAHVTFCFSVRAGGGAGAAGRPRPHA